MTATSPESPAQKSGIPESIKKMLEARRQHVDDPTVVVPQIIPETPPEPVKVKPIVEKKEEYDDDPELPGPFDEEEDEMGSVNEENKIARQFKASRPGSFFLLKSLKKFCVRNGFDFSKMESELSSLRTMFRLADIHDGKRESIKATGAKEQEEDTLLIEAEASLAQLVYLRDNSLSDKVRLDASKDIMDRLQKRKKSDDEKPYADVPTAKIVESLKGIPRSQGGLGKELPKHPLVGGKAAGGKSA